MKKYLISMVIMSLTCMAALSQNVVVNNPNNKAYFGLRVGGDITCPGKISAENIGISVFKNGGGVEFGGICNLPIVANFYVEPGIKFYYNTYSYKDELVEALQLNSMSIKKFGLRIPVMLGYHFDFTEDVKTSLFMGPELEVGLSAKEYTKGHNIEMSESIYGGDGGMKRVNLLWGIGVGISYQHFYFGVNGGIGMLNMYSDSDVKYHENRVTFSIGYNF